MRHRDSVDGSGRSVRRPSWKRGTPRARENTHPRPTGAATCTVGCHEPHPSSLATVVCTEINAADLKVPAHGFDSIDTKAASEVTDID